MCCFFFKQKTAYDMRISDWSSDVCSSDLEARMAVIPVGAVLHDREFVGESRLRQDAGKADAGHAVHVEGQDEAVPVDGRVLVQRVFDVDPDILAFAKADERGGEHAVHCDRVAGAAANGEGDVDRKSTRLTSSH